jgi:pimeloyl-ACP methyl ester carboxylesterase
MRRWIEDLRRHAAQPPGATLPREEARRRLVSNHPGVPEEVIGERLVHLVEETADGRVRWRVDALHRTTAPVPFFAQLFMSFARAVTCPVLFVSGGETGFHVPDEEARLAAFTRLERTTLDGAGHMIHWTRPSELAERLVTFFA